MSPIYLLALEFLRSAIAGFCFRQFGLRASQVGLVRNALERFLRLLFRGQRGGFVKLFAEPGSGSVLGGVVVAPRASELIFPVTLAVAHRLNVDQIASTFTVYPSLSGSIAEAARRLHATD